MKVRLVLLPAICILALPVLAYSQWIQSGSPVSTAANAQQYPRAVSDGAGGVITVWHDLRGADMNLYAQRIDANGVPLWAMDGVPISTAAGDQELPNIVSDGAGGAIIVWDDSRAGLGLYDIYAQRVNANGTALWAANGVVICNAINIQNEPAIVSDGVGGAIMAWRDTRNDPINTDVYAQRVNGSGVVQWVANGRSVCVAAGSQVSVQMATDGASGAIITWMDLRSGTNLDLYAQRMSATGSQQWVAGGVAVCTEPSNQAYEQLVSDGAGGAVIAWHDERNLPGSDIYAQRINSSGVPAWTVDGVAVCLAQYSQDNPVLVADGSGGALIAWDDLRKGDASYDVYARRISGSGVPQWAKDGIPICTADSDQFRQVVAPDNAGGFVVAWLDNRSGQRGYYAQRVTRNGDLLWLANGVPAWPAQGFLSLLSIVPDASGGAIIVGPEQRSETDDLYAQRIEGSLGTWGHPEPTVTSVADVRNDQGGKVKVNWKASGRDVVPQTMVTHYSIWRATDVAAAASMISSPASITKDFAGKATWVQKSAATSYYWELVGTQDATRQTGYSLSADTRADSVAGNPATHHFMVVAHADDPFLFWTSNEMSGRSVDNLAPLAPLALAAQRAGNYVYLKWNRVRVPDLRNYSVYRKTSSGVTPVPVNFLADATDTVLTDNNAPASAAYYIVTAKDVHANQSAASNEAAVGAATGVGNTPPITTLMVMQNRPNPFGTSSSFDLGLPVASSVSVEVFDVGGRRVASHTLGNKPAGWQTVALDARDDAGRPLASGVYFYRLHAAGQTLTRKMVIAR